MRAILFAILPLAYGVGAAMAQPTIDSSIPHEIGNRENGFSYQPTPNEVVPREVLAGVRPSPTQQIATDHELEVLDRTLLREEGLNENSLPDFKPYN